MAQASETSFASPRVVLLNQQAGRRMRNARSRVEHALHDAGLAATVREVPPARLREAVAELVAAGADVVPVAGGDGTLRAAARALLGSSAALAPVPTGTLNHFARRVGMEDPETAARALRSGVIREVAVGLAGDTVFLNTCSCGGYADVVRRREKLRPALTKWPAAVAGMLEAAWKFPVLRVSLEAGPDHRVRETPLVWIGMGRGSFPFSHEADDGPAARELEVVIFRATRRRDLLRLGVRFLAGVTGAASLPDGRAFEVLHTRGLFVDARGRLDATVDGEPLRVIPPLRITVASERLRVLMPAEP